jgi:hypothetical protein
MNDDKDQSSSVSGDLNIASSQVPGSEIERRPYEKPQVIYRAPLEAMASVCAPAPPAKSNPGICPSGPISS